MTRFGENGLGSDVLITLHGVNKVTNARLMPLDQSEARMGLD